MVKLVFTASHAEAEAKAVTITHGSAHTAYLWNQKKTYDWNDFADLFREAKVGPKQGTCFVPAIFSGINRRRDQATRIDVVVLDSDSGHNLGEISRAVKAHGWRSIIHSTHSHMTDQTIISANAFDQWKSSDEGKTISAYMAEKKGYLPSVIAGAEIIDETTEGNARVYAVKHQPCPKYRIIIPLQTPWIASNYQTHQIAQAAWHERIGSLGRALNIDNDMSCTDVSRLFFFPRRKEGQDYQIEVIDGADCDLWSLPENVPKKATEATPLFQVVDQTHKVYTDPSGQKIDLTAWAAKYAARFEVVNAIRARASSIIGKRLSGVKVHITCPNSGKHTSGETDQTGTYAVNASQIKRSGLPSINGFALHCMHAGCSGIDRLDHLKAMLESGNLTIADLTEFVIPEFPLADVSAVIDGKPETGNIHQKILADLPGVMGDMHDYMVRTSTKPQPALCLGATLAFMGACLGQRVMVQGWKTRPNLYCVGICYSGAGKERPLSAVKTMAAAAGMADTLIGVESIASDAAIINHAIHRPRSVMLLDEVAGIISTANSKNAGPHMMGVIDALLKLYSSSHTRFTSKSYADITKTKYVDEPCIGLYGCTTPSNFSSALTSRDITSGLLSRLVIFDGGDHDPKGKPSEDMDVPKSVIDWIKAWDRTRPNGEGYLIQNGMPVIPKYAVMMTDEAKQLIDRFDDEMREAKLKAREHNTDSLYVRAVENALKFALVRACSGLPVSRDGLIEIDPSTLAIDADCARWAIGLSRATVQTMEDVARHHVADSAFEEKRKRLCEFIRKGGKRGKTRRDLVRNGAGRMPEKELDELLKSLCVAEDVVFVSVPAIGAGRPREAFVHGKFLERAAEDE